MKMNAVNRKVNESINLKKIVIDYFIYKTM